MGLSDSIDPGTQDPILQHILALLRGGKAPMDASLPEGGIRMPAFGVQTPTMDAQPVAPGMAAPDKFTDLRAQLNPPPAPMTNYPEAYNPSPARDALLKNRLLQGGSATDGSGGNYGVLEDDPIRTERAQKIWQQLRSGGMSPAALDRARTEGLVSGEGQHGGYTSNAGALIADEEKRTGEQAGESAFRAALKRRGIEVPDHTPMSAAQALLGTEVKAASAGAKKGDKIDTENRKHRAGLYLGPDLEPSDDLVAKAAAGEVDAKSPGMSGALKHVSDLNVASSGFSDIAQQAREMLAKHPDGALAGTDATKLHAIFTDMRSLYMANLNMKTLREFDVPILNAALTDPTQLSTILKSKTGVLDLSAQLEQAVNLSKQRVLSEAGAIGYKPSAKGRYANFQQKQEGAVSAPALSPQDAAAIDWAKSHATDPRAAKILQMHGMGTP